MSKILKSFKPRVIHFWPSYCYDEIKKYKKENPNVVTIADQYMPNPVFVLDIMEPVYDSYGLQISNTYLECYSNNIMKHFDGADHHQGQQHHPKKRSQMPVGQRQQQSEGDEAEHVPHQIAHRPGGRKMPELVLYGVKRGQVQVIARFCPTDRQIRLNSLQKTPKAAIELYNHKGQQKEQISREGDPNGMLL